MSVVVSFVLSFFPRDVLDEILGLIGSVSEDFPSCSCYRYNDFRCNSEDSDQPAHHLNRITNFFPILCTARM